MLRDRIAGSVGMGGGDLALGMRTPLSFISFIFIQFSAKITPNTVIAFLDHVEAYQTHIQTGGVGDARPFLYSFC